MGRLMPINLLGKSSAKMSPHYNFWSLPVCFIAGELIGKKERWLEYMSEVLDLV